MELVDVKFKREFEQQEFVQELADKIRHEANESENYEECIFNVFMALMEDLRIRLLYRQIPADEQPKRNSQSVDLVMPLLEQMLAFKRADSEVEYLEYLLAEDLWKTIASKATRQYQHESTHEPEKVLDLTPLVGIRPSIDHLSDDLLNAYRADKLYSRGRRAVEQHLARCAYCRGKRGD